MKKRPFWQAAEALIRVVLGQTIEEWPLGYIRFSLRGNRYCLTIPTHMTKPELMLLYRLGLTLGKGATLVEIGSYLGASSCCLAAAAREIEGHLWCVDTWQNEGMSEGPRDTYVEFIKNVAPYISWITPLRGRSDDIAQNSHNRVDLLFLDGDHSFEGVCTDLNSWVPQLRPGGWLLMHDWGWAEGVQRAIKEMVTPIQVDTPETLPNLYAVRVDPRIGGYN